MPIYVFRCAHCGNRFEKLVLSAAGVDQVSCPNCGSVDLAREMSTFATTSTSRGTAPSSPAPT